jgi:hypothetical protein
MCLASLMRASHARKGVPFSGVQPNPGHGASVSVFVHRQADFVMHGSPNNLRITWQFFDKDFLAVDAFKTQRNFHTYDEKYFDHFNLRVSAVRSPVLAQRVDVLFVTDDLDTAGFVPQTSGAPLVEVGVSRPFDLPKQEDSRPSVMLLNHAAAYGAWYEVRPGLGCLLLDGLVLYMLPCVS